MGTQVAITESSSINNCVISKFVISESIQVSIHHLRRDSLVLQPMQGQDMGIVGEFVPYKRCIPRGKLVHVLRIYTANDQLPSDIDLPFMKALCFE